MPCIVILNSVHQNDFPGFSQLPVFLPFPALPWTDKATSTRMVSSADRAYMKAPISHSTFQLVKKVIKYILKGQDFL